MREQVGILNRVLDVVDGMLFVVRLEMLKALLCPGIDFNDFL